MFELLREVASTADVVSILESTLVTENVGAFPGRGPVEALNKCSRGNCTAAIGTACKCHGIVNFFEIRLVSGWTPTSKQGPRRADPL